jgi:pimeloyl-ACP methyl ester carboxylesterase
VTTICTNTIMINTLSKTILFIPGAFLADDCWNNWRSYFETKGYTTIATPWPHKNAPPESLRNNVVENTIASVRLTELLDHYTAILRSLPDTPILIGHSVGGLIVQLLLQRGLGAAGIALHSFPPRRTSPFPFSFTRSWWELLGFFSPAKENYLLPFKKWKHSVANGIDCELAKDLYYRYAVPESKRLIRDLFIGRARINFSSPHAALLLVSGGKDRMIPAHLNYKNFTSYTTRYSTTDYVNFTGHNHLVFDDPEYKEIADYILFWLSRI